MVFNKENKKKFFKFLEDSKNEKIIKFIISCEFFEKIKQEFEEQFLFENEFLITKIKNELEVLYSTREKIYSIELEKIQYNQNYYHNKKEAIEEHLSMNDSILFKGSSTFDYNTYYKYFKYLIKININFYHDNSYNENLFRSRCDSSDWYMSYNTPITLREVNNNKKIIINDISDIKLKYDSTNCVYKIYNKNDVIYLHKFKNNDKIFNENVKKIMLKNIIELINNSTDTINFYNFFKRYE